jgi:hypothetical protein
MNKVKDSDQENWMIKPKYTTYLQRGMERVSHSLFRIACNNTNTLSRQEAPKISVIY